MAKEAQRVMREADGLREELALWGALLKRADDLEEIAELAQSDPELAAEIDVEADALRADYERNRTTLLFSGPYDERNALLTVSAGAGGTEATDWAEMLLRMYLRWAERHRAKTEVLDQLEGEQAVITQVNVPVEFMPPEKAERVRAIWAKRYTLTSGEVHPLLSDDEITNLVVQRGNITGDELAIMRDHARVSMELL